MNKKYVLTICLLFLVGFAIAQTPPVTWQAKWLRVGYREDTLQRPAQYFQKRFEAAQKVKSAKLYVTCHGLYEASLNGKRVGNAYLTPGWTEYTKRLPYQVYDVTAMLAGGSNELTIAVGDGWFRGHVGYEDMSNLYGSHLALLAQLEITYTDGKKEVIGSDERWTCGEGPIRENSINNGELVDATKSISCANPVAVANYGYQGLYADEAVSVTKHETFKAVKVTSAANGDRILDFGQNLVGWVRVRLRGHKGDTVSIRHAEVLDKAGNFYTENLRTAKTTASYVLSGGEDHLEPHFTYFGFRYIKVSGIKGELNPDDFTAVALYADMKPSGTFACSNPLLNQLQHNIVWGQKGNFLVIPTDCPQRDERLGWTGDAQVFARTASFNFDVNRYFSNWMKDVALNQRPDGAISWVVPNILGQLGGSAGWGDVSTVIPWTLYEVYGNQQVLKDQYNSMKAWVEFMHANSLNDLWNKGDHFGDWLSYRDPFDDGTDAVTDKYEIAQCFYAYSTQLLINAARVLGKTDDVNNYTGLLEKIKQAYRKEYMTYSGRLLSNTQTAYVLALNFDMLDEKDRPVAARYLVNNIRAYKDHLTTGFLGTPYLCHVLSRFGYTDVAYQLLLQDTFPSWLYPVKMGATTIWERWDGIKPDGSFQTAHMNSFNHYAYGAIGDWMYQHIAGIQCGSPGFKYILIKPLPGGNLTWCKADYNCPQGKISVSWKIKDGRFNLDVTIPTGSAAEISVPDASGHNVQLKQVEAGTYHFEN